MRVREEIIRRIKLLLCKAFVDWVLNQRDTAIQYDNSGIQCYFTAIIVLSLTFLLVFITDCALRSYLPLIPVLVVFIGFSGKVIMDRDGSRVPIFVVKAFNPIGQYADVIDIEMMRPMGRVSQN